MMLGRQTVIVVTPVLLLDQAGDPVLTEIGANRFTEHTESVDGCLFEVQDISPSGAEMQTSTTTTHATAWCLMPITPVTRAIDSTMALRYGGRDWQMRGDARIEVDLDGIEDHVFCLCEAQRG